MWKIHRKFILILFLVSCEWNPVSLARFDNWQQRRPNATLAQNNSHFRHHPIPTTRNPHQNWSGPHHGRYNQTSANRNLQWNNTTGIPSQFSQGRVINPTNSTFVQPNPWTRYINRTQFIAPTPMWGRQPNNSFPTNYGNSPRPINSGSLGWNQTRFAAQNPTRSTNIPTPTNNLNAWNIGPRNDTPKHMMGWHAPSNNTQFSPGIGNAGSSNFFNSTHSGWYAPTHTNNRNLTMGPNLHGLGYSGLIQGHTNTTKWNIPVASTERTALKPGPQGGSGVWMPQGYSGNRQNIGRPDSTQWDAVNVPNNAAAGLSGVPLAPLTYSWGSPAHSPDGNKPKSENYNSNPYANLFI